jgi:hypothetical protein
MGIGDREITPGQFIRLVISVSAVVCILALSLTCGQEAPAAEQKTVLELHKERIKLQDSMKQLSDKFTKDRTAFEDTQPAKDHKAKVEAAVKAMNDEFNKTKETAAYKKDAEALQERYKVANERLIAIERQIIEAGDKEARGK